MKNKRIKIVLEIIIVILLIFIIFMSSKIFLPSKSYILIKNGIEVSFNVPYTLNEDKKLSNTKTRMFDKQISSHSNESISVIVGSHNYTVNEYMEEVVVQTKNAAKKIFKNAKLSEIETKVVNNKTFFYRTLSYQYSLTGSTVYETYICCELDGTDKIYMVEIDGKEHLTEKEIDTLLNISIY